MGPYSEIKQLERKCAVVRLLQQDNLSEWARAYWGQVCDTIARDEARYNDRVKHTFRNHKNQGWISYE